jgi:hypothetical protein
MSKRTAWISICCIIAVGAVFGTAAEAWALGEVWRYPQEWMPVEGAHEMALPAGQVEDKAGRLSRRARRKGIDAVPEVLVEILDGEGRPVPGIGVDVGARFGRKSSDTVRMAGATGPEGTFRLLPDPAAGLTKLAFDLRRSGGYVVVSAYLEPARDGGLWLAEAPYKDLEEMGDAGSCMNLFRLEYMSPTSGEGRAYRLSFQVPDTLLECEEVAYGLDRKSAAYASLNDVGRRDLNDGDKNFFSPGDEQKMGLEASKELDSQLEIIHDAEITGYIQRMVEEIVAASDDPSMPINLRVVHTDDVNAFVTMGGHVYVFTGLIKAAENESQVAGVLAHEVSHAIARHVTEGATRSMKLQYGTLLGALAVGAATDMDDKEQEALMMGSLATAGLVGMKYDRRAETEADLLGAQYLWRAGWDPEGIARFFEVLERDSEGASPPGWLSTHPTHDRRIQSGIYWARAYLPSKSRYLVNTPTFDEVKARIEALPPPKKPSPLEGKGFMDVLGATPSYQRVVKGSYLGAQSD